MKILDVYCENIANCHHKGLRGPLSPRSNLQWQFLGLLVSKPSLENLFLYISYFLQVKTLKKYRKTQSPTSNFLVFISFNDSRDIYGEWNSCLNSIAKKMICRENWFSNAGFDNNNPKKCHCNLLNGFKGPLIFSQ